MRQLKVSKRGGGRVLLGRKGQSSAENWDLSTEAGQLEHQERSSEHVRPGWRSGATEVELGQG